jgi:signal transduction histidine kinase
MKDGSAIVVRIVANPVADESGAVVYIEGIVEDVTERLKREENLRRNERMASLGTMLAGVAHELNNPLAAISGFAQIILRGDTLSEDDRAAMETIKHEAGRAARIVRDLQTFARERSYTHREESDLNEVVTYVLSSQRYQMESHGIQRKMELAPALPSVRAERAHVEQILINLLSNATRALESITDAPATRSEALASNEVPTIRVSTGLTDTTVTLEVRDNGPGILASDLPRVFDPFFTTRAEGEGTGLGLAVVHGIVASYGGNLEVESEPGHGALFRVSFPLLGVAADINDSTASAPAGQVSATEPVAASHVAQPAGPKQLEILVVEDEGAIRKLLARYFESRGHAVTVAGDGPSALLLAEQSAFDVVVCDLRLPGIDGLEVLRRLRELPTGARARVIIMSGAKSKVTESAVAESLRISAVVDKPFEIEQLRSAVED